MLRTWPVGDKIAAMKTKNQIHIANGEGGFHISFSRHDTEFVAKSVEIEPAPNQPGTLVWMRDVKLTGGAVETTMDNPWDEHPFMSYYLDKDGEEIGEELMQYMSERGEALTMN